jgi:hypothetical protein
MAEPQDSGAHGVVSALKSLRTRAGLREERLHNTELDLDALIGLDGVQAFIGAGEGRERAIVLAVRAAAGTLEPTMSIVVDASLGLELFADQVPDPDLYAQDVGKRRDAVLRNWDRLHKLRSAPPGKAPSPRALRFEMESEALAALAVAMTREPQSDEGTTSSDLRIVLRTFGDVGKALRDRLIRNVDGVPTGWQQDLDGPGIEATAVSTAYGIRTMLLLEDNTLAVDLIPVAQRLKGMVHKDGGYASSVHKEPSAEATASVLNALGRIAVTEDFGPHIRQMEEGLTDFEKARPFILTTMLEACLLLMGGEGLVDQLVDCLLAARRPVDDGRLVWSEKSGRIYAEPSVAHTARAVRALAKVREIRSDSRLDEPLEQAVDWLLGPRDLHNTDENVERDPPVGTYHFTAAWVVKALISAGVPATHVAVSNAISRIWDSYVGDKGDKDVALWRSHRGDLPIWTTFDAIEALRLAYFPARTGPALPPYGRRDVTG